MKESCKPIKNILFVMADQLRWDYLSCYGHPHLHTPNIDRLAEKGVRFDRAYVQSPVCGPSRASFYTGRTVFSHGSTWNRVPLPIGELTLGDYLRPTGVRTAVVGKTHMVPDAEGMGRLGTMDYIRLGCCVHAVASFATTIGCVIMATQETTRGMTMPMRQRGRMAKFFPVGTFDTQACLPALKRSTQKPRT